MARTYTRLLKHINHIYNIASIPVFFPNLAGRRTKREAELLVAEELAASAGEGGALA
ncbi:hypothetical protein BJ742DRAFT_773672 [Cladochytrium replicatum]|nr:hypothetical protein BJ742DRAFT_773672 [Cladochytrium replicatum]